METETRITKVAVAIAGSVDSGKCFKNGTKVLMSDNYSKNIEDIQVGDYVMGDDFLPRKVIESHIGYAQLYEIKTDDNKSYYVNKNHILCLMCNLSNEVQNVNINQITYCKNDIIEISVEDYIKTNIRYYDALKKYFNWYRLANSEITQCKIEIELSDFYDYTGFEIGGNGRFLLEDYSVVHNSSFVGVMVNKVLDDGNGSARKFVAKHPHEIESGRTSDISTQLYDLTDKNESVTFIDLCGHKAYFGTTTYGISSHFPDYAFLIMSANKDKIPPMTKQHMRLLLSLSIPVVIILSRIDLSPPDVYNNAKKGIKKLCEVYSGSKVSVNFVNDIKDMEKTDKELLPIKEKSVETTCSAIMNITDGKQTMFPVISVSNKTGFFIDVVRVLMNKLKPRPFWLPGGHDAVMNNKVVKLFKGLLEAQKVKLSDVFPKYKEFTGSVFYINGVFSPPGKGLVVSGINRGDKFVVGDNVYIGPINNKDFYQIRAKSFHNNISQDKLALYDHDRGSVAFALVDNKIDLKRKSIKKGTIILSSLDLLKNVCFKFKALVTFFAKSLTIKIGYSPVLHLNTISQSARIIEINPLENNGNSVIEFNDKTETVAIVSFKFKAHPQFVELYNLFVLRSGEIQGVGLIIGITPIKDDEEAKPDTVKVKKYARKRKIIGKLLKK